MTRLLTCIFALIIAAPTAFAADGAISRAIPTAKKTENSSSATERGTVSRVATRPTGQVPDVQNTVSRVFTGATTDKKKTDTPVDPARATIISRALTSSSDGEDVARSNLSTAVNTVGRNKRVSSASINSNPVVRRAGLTLRPSTAEVGGRATIGDTGQQTGSNIDEVVRSIQSRAAAEKNRETIAQATERLEQTATLNKSCQQQYNECMDQFCAVIDANQGRCSCSSNLSRYTKVEEAVKDANNQLNEVAQRIRYVGLSADEIRAIMTETEAEEALSGTVDTSENRNLLQEIEDLIRDPVSNSSYSSDTFSTFDMDLDFSSETADLFSLDFLNTDSASSFSNLRGSDLYSAAKKRCTTVLNQCKGAGATVSQITGNYDLAIDKDCIAYEQGLTKMNETLVSNVRSANRMLQKARLAVLQNKNQYDAKGCIAALETCMKDDMVCGDDYFKCVDPTKRYIDENGNVVLGQKISDITEFMKSYNNATIDTTFLTDAYSSQKISDTDCKAEGSNDGSCVAKYLLQKIGTKQSVTEEGLCRAVLDKCQRYTYDDNGKYKPYNDVVINYVQRAMVNINSAQQNIISDYASSCMLDIASCYNQQVSQLNSWSSSASIKSIYNVMRGACRNVALTCAYAIFYNSEIEICIDNSGKTECSVVTEPTDEQYLEGVSEMFYQSLLCPENSIYQSTAAEPDKIANGSGNSVGFYVNAHCMCKNGYEPWGNSCVAHCGNNAIRNTYGSCVCEDNYYMKNSKCVYGTGTGMI